MKKNEVFHEIYKNDQITSKEEFISSKNEEKQNQNKKDNYIQNLKKEKSKNQNTLKEDVSKKHWQDYGNPRLRMELFDKSRRNKLKSNTQRTTISNKKEDIKIKEPIKKEEEHEEDLNISEKEKDLSKNAKNKIKKLNEQNDEPIVYMKSNNYLQTVDPIPQINFVPKKKFPLKWKIIIISSIILLLLLIIFLILYFTGVISPSKPPEESETNYKQEDLISGLNYKQNQIMKFRNIKRTNIFFDFADMDPSNNSKTLIEYFDYVIGITNHDKVIENSIEKDTFSGFIFLENYLIDNETDKMLLQNSNLLEQNEKRNNKRN